MTEFGNISFIEKSEEIVIPSLASLDNVNIINSISVTGKTINSKKLSNYAAASKIQRAWRRYIDIQVFKYYKDLIEFHNSGDPMLFMRCINPIEAKFIDNASGIRVKFRLAGDKFPPTIYYKIFTHRPIQDICANAPRDYTRPYLKKKTAAINNNKFNLFPAEDKNGWYRRIENNGWRPVSTKHLEQMNMEFYYGVNDIRNNPIEFKHSKILRKQDLEKKKKKTKIEWMKKMYKEGMLKARSNDRETNMIIEEAARNLIDTIETDGYNSIEDWEVNELLEWTNMLNFDDYATNWSTLGTTACSDKLVVERIKLKYGNIYEVENTLSDTESPDMSVQATGYTPHQTSAQHFTNSESRSSPT